MADKRTDPQSATGSQPGPEAGQYNPLKEKVRQFYKKIADPTQRLVIATYEGDIDQALDAIEAGADINAIHPGTKMPVIHLAAGRGHTELVNALLRAGTCDLTIRDQSGRLASDCAAYSAQDFEMAERLAEEEAQQFRIAGKNPRRGAAK